MFCNPLPRRITSNVRFSSSLERKTWGRYSSRGHWTKSNKQKIFELKKIECFILEWVRLSSVIERSEVELFTKKTRMEQNRSIDPALKQLRLFEVLVPFITVFPYSELTLSTDYSLQKVYQGKILTLQFWKPKSSWTMTVRFCSRYHFGHRTHKNTHTHEKSSVFAFVRWPTALNSSVRKSLIELNWKFCLILLNFIWCLIITDFPGPAPNRFIVIYWKRCQDGTERNLINLLKLANPG